MLKNIQKFFNKIKFKFTTQNNEIKITMHI